MNNIYSNSINRYDEMIYNSRPVTFDEFMSDKYNRVHIELFNDALKKYYDDIVNTYVNEKFLFNFFKIIENTYNSDIDIYYETFYNKLMNDKNNYVHKAVKELSIDGDKFYRYIFDLINEKIDAIKNTIIEKEVLKNIFSLSSIGDFRIIYSNNITYLESEDKFVFRNNEDEYNHIFASYIINHDSDNDTYELIEEDFFVSEDNDYVFILENESGLRIGYNIHGEFLLILDEASYNEFNDFNFFSYLDNTNNGLLDECKIYTLSLYKDNHRVAEMKNDEYWKPSKILIMSNVHPYTKEVVDLSDYWNYNQSKEDYNISDIKLTDTEIQDAELLEINYIQGTAKMRSKTTDIEFTIPVSYLNQDTSVSEDLSIDLIK